MSETVAVTEQKRQLRARAIAQRSRLDPAQRAADAERLSRIGLSFLGLPAPVVVSAFLAIGEELDPEPLLATLQNQGHTLALPVMQAKGQPLLFRSWAPGAALVPRMWGIREPDAGAPLVEPDVLLVPLLAFDRAGHRLGYGGGFYDRTLAALRARRAIVAIGLAFASQGVDEVPHLDYDERLDWVLTPDGPISCTI